MEKQVNDNPPYNSPWCFFDLSEIYFFQNDFDNFFKMLNRGLQYSKKWQAKTHFESLTLINDENIPSEYLSDGLNIIEKAISYLPED